MAHGRHLEKSKTAISPQQNGINATKLRYFIEFSH